MQELLEEKRETVENLQQMNLQYEEQLIKKTQLLYEVMNKTEEI